MNQMKSCRLFVCGCNVTVRITMIINAFLLYSSLFGIKWNFILDKVLLYSR